MFERMNQRRQLHRVIGGLQGSSTAAFPRYLLNPRPTARPRIAKARTIRSNDRVEPWDDLSDAFRSSLLLPSRFAFFPSRVTASTQIVDLPGAAGCADRIADSNGVDVRAGFRVHIVSRVRAVLRVRVNFLVRVYDIEKIALDTFRLRSQRGRKPKRCRRFLG